MSSRNPENWKLPAGWQPLREGRWEFEQLRSFSSALLARDPSFDVVLDAFEDGYLKVDVSRRGSKIGEVFVNRDPRKPSSAVFRLFVGHEGHEQDVGTIDEAIACVLGATGVWRDHPGSVI